MCKPRWQHRLAWTPLLEQRGQASGWCNVKAKLRWGVFLFSHLFKMLSDHQHLTGSLSRPHEGLWPELALLKVLGWQGVGAAWVLGDEMRWDRLWLSFLLVWLKAAGSQPPTLPVISVPNGEPSLKTGLHQTRLVLEESTEDSPHPPTQTTLLILELKASSGLRLAVLTIEGEST